ncbi:MAG: hypothetical protein IPM50_00085 [Acidobacteriota bacterium]|nr:MAG: hypothetical protein IPM50_00085 [Acidobacteriota bacterium]
MNYQQLHEAVKSGSVVGAVDNDGKKHRFFISDGGSLCRFKPRSSRRGYTVYESDLAIYSRFISSKPPQTGEEKIRKEYRLIEKYKRMAGEASFSNPFIRDCLALPDIDAWRKDLVEPNSWETGKSQRPKTLYELHITTGTNIDGKVISLNRIAKKYPREIERLREAIRMRSAGAFITGRWAKFAGYDISIETDLNTETGDFRGFLSLEYAGCGNGYYYLLINDENFIGYDVD